MNSKIILLVFLASVSTAVVADECVKNTPIGCPIVGGVQKICSCSRSCNCCTCRCPSDTHEMNVTAPEACVPKAEILGEECQRVGSAWMACSLIPNSECLESESLEKNTCECKDGYSPSDNMRSCLHPPTKLGQPCSTALQCPTSISRSLCLPVGSQGEFQCGCEAGYFADSTSTRCIPEPKTVGDECSASATCDRVSASGCKDNACVCWDKYLPSKDGSACVPTKIGMGCPGNSNCELMPGARCFGSKEDAICICPWNIPNFQLSKCSGF